MDESFAAQMIAYHEASKHHYRTYTPGPGYLDWATQRDPFRRYTGAQVIPLVRPTPDEDLPRGRLHAGPGARRLVRRCKRLTALLRHPGDFGLEGSR